MITISKEVQTKHDSRINRSQLIKIGILYNKHSYKTAIKDLHIIGKTGPNQLTYTEAQLLIRHKGAFPRGGRIRPSNENTVEPDTTWHGVVNWDVETPIIDIKYEEDESATPEHGDSRFEDTVKTKQPSLKKEYNSIWDEPTSLQNLPETVIPKKMSEPIGPVLKRLHKKIESASNVLKRLNKKGEIEPTFKDLGLLFEGISNENIREDTNSSKQSEGGLLYGRKYSKLPERLSDVKK